MVQHNFIDTIFETKLMFFLMELYG